MKFMPRFMAMTLITLMAGAHAGQAAAPDGDTHRPPRPPMHGMSGEGPMGQGLMWDLQRVKAELKLSPEQEASWQAAVDASKAARESMRKQHDDFRAAIKAEQQKDVLDLAKLDQALEQQREQGRAAHEAVKQKWLAIYAGLNTDQKRVVSQRIKDKLARLDHLRERFKDRKRPRPDGEAPKG